MLSKKSQTAINLEIAKYPEAQKQSAVMAALRIVQKENAGSLTTQLMDMVADYLEMPKIKVYEVANFYSMYELQPVGKHKICVCTNISCMLCGSRGIVEHLESRFEIKMGQTTKNGEVTLKEVECLGACVNAPMFQIGEKYYENLTNDKIDKILEKLIK